MTHPTMSPGRGLTQRFRSGLCWIAALWALQSLTGCADQPTLIDRQFGTSTHEIKVQQSVHPYGRDTAYPPMASEGVIGKSAIDRYHRSYELPPPPTNVYNIGVGTPMTAAQPAR